MAEAVITPAEMAEETDTAGPPALVRIRSKYTRFVGTMKLVLPVIAGGLIAMVLVWPQMKDQPQVLGLAVLPAEIEEAGGGQTVTNARFRGVDGKEQPYVLTADEARLSNARPDQIELTNPKADIKLQGGAEMEAVAPDGVYLKNRSKLELSGGISLSNDDGYKFKTESVTIDLRRGTAMGTQRVEGEGPAGTLAARGIEVLGQGDRINFTGRSKLVLFDNARKGGK